MDQSPKKRTESDKRTTVPRNRTEAHYCGPESEEWTEGPMNRTITEARTYVRSSEYYPKILDRGTRRFRLVTEVSEHDLKRYSGFGQLRDPKGTRTVDSQPFPSVSE